MKSIDRSVDLSLFDPYDALIIATHLAVLLTLGYTVENDYESEVFKVRVFKAEHDRIIEVCGAQSIDLVAAFRAAVSNVAESMPDGEFERRLNQVQR